MRSKDVKLGESYAAEPPYEAVKRYIPEQEVWVQGTSKLMSSGYLPVSTGERLLWRQESYKTQWRTVRTPRFVKGFRGYEVGKPDEKVLIAPKDMLGQWDAWYSANEAENAAHLQTQLDLEAETKVRVEIVNAALKKAGFSSPSYEAVECRIRNTHTITVETVADLENLRNILQAVGSLKVEIPVTRLWE